MSTDLKQLERQARWAYEGARLTRAFVGFTPVLVVVAIAACVGARQLMIVALGGVLFALGTVLLWFGRDPAKAVLPGVVAGILPLSLSLCANHLGHACMGAQCMTLCLPACSIGGLGAGIFVAWYGLRRQRTAWFWVLATALTVLTGALGCSCVGLAGVAGLATGYAAGVVPGIVRALQKRRGASN